MLAKKNANYPLINLLIQYKAVINIEGEDNLNILQYAAANNNIDDTRVGDTLNNICSCNKKNAQ